MELKKLLIAISVSGAFALGGCSSGSDGSDDSANGPDDSEKEEVQLTGVTTGVFVDSAVSGLEYSASPSGIEGVTDDEGTFEYEDGDTVTFSVGSVEIGRVSASGVITPLNVAGVDAASGNDYVANIAQMLQSLDDDGFAGNGIELTDETREYAANQLNGNEFDPASQNEADFEKGLGNEISGLTASNRETRDKVVDRDKAINHVQNTVNSINRITSCTDEGARSVKDGELDDSAFVTILSGSDSESEVRIDFAADGTFDELSNDNSNYETNANSGNWTRMDNGTVLELDRGNGDVEQLDVCISEADESLLVGFEEENAFSRAAPQGSLTESSDVVGNYTLTVEGDRIGRLTITGDSELAATLRTSDGSFSGDAAITDGNLEITNLEGRENATAYWAKGAVNQSAVYVEGMNTSSVTLGKIEALGPVTQAEETTFADRTIFTVDENDEIAILWFDRNSQDSFEEYANDFYQNSQRSAKRRPGSWQYQNDELALEFDDGETIQFAIDEGSSRLYAQESGTNATNDGEFTFLKPSRVSTAGMIGEYDVSVPTENTSERSLKLGKNGDCLLEGDITCTWEVAENQRRIDITLTDGSDLPIFVWKHKDSDQYAYLQGPFEGTPEPGVMIEQ